MDAKITKSRLGNFLSYEWIKMVICAILAALLVVVVMVTVSTKATPAQTFSVMTYIDVTGGFDLTDYGEKTTKDIFSYEILTGDAEMLDTDNGETVFAARRIVGEGDVLFISHGKEDSLMQTLVEEELDDSVDPQAYLLSVEQYLNGFYGGNLQSGTLDRAKAEQAFYARKQNDKRFRTEAQKAEGVQQECARLELLKNDLLAVKSYFADGTLSFTELTLQDGTKKVCSIDLSSPKMSRITEFACYAVKDENGEETGRTNVGLQLMILDNAEDDGELFYETVSFLRYLVQKYGQTV